MKPARSQGHGERSKISTCEGFAKNDVEIRINERMNVNDDSFNTMNIAGKTTEGIGEMECGLRSASLPDAIRISRNKADGRHVVCLRGKHDLKRLRASVTFLVVALVTMAVGAHNSWTGDRKEKKNLVFSRQVQRRTQEIPSHSPVVSSSTIPPDAIPLNTALLIPSAIPYTSTTLPTKTPVVPVVPLAPTVSSATSVTSAVPILTTLSPSKLAPDVPAVNSDPPLSFSQSGKPFSTDESPVFSIVPASYFSPEPSVAITAAPEVLPATDEPTGSPYFEPSTRPFYFPVSLASGEPSVSPSLFDAKTEYSPISTDPVQAFSEAPTQKPSPVPSSADPTLEPSSTPSSADPTQEPSSAPSSADPTQEPSAIPSPIPSSADPTQIPSSRPSSTDPTEIPSPIPSSTVPTHIPSPMPSLTDPPMKRTPIPTAVPKSSSVDPTLYPSPFPSQIPTFTSIAPISKPNLSPVLQQNQRDDITTAPIQEVATAGVPTLVPTFEITENELPSDETTSTSLPVPLPTTSSSVTLTVSPGDNLSPETVETPFSGTITPTVQVPLTTTIPPITEAPLTETTEAPLQSPWVDLTESPVVIPTLETNEIPSDETIDSPLPATIPATIIPTASPVDTPTIATTDELPSNELTDDPVGDLPTNPPLPSPTSYPVAVPIESLTVAPSTIPFLPPSPAPLAFSTSAPVAVPTSAPVTIPTPAPVAIPTPAPVAIPNPAPVAISTPSPSRPLPNIFEPTPTFLPTQYPIEPPTKPRTKSPSKRRTVSPTDDHTGTAITDAPTRRPTDEPVKRVELTASPSLAPIFSPIAASSRRPSLLPSRSPTGSPSTSFSPSVSVAPSAVPTPSFLYDKVSLLSEGIVVVAKRESRRLQEESAAYRALCVDQVADYMANTIRKEVEQVVLTFETLDVLILNSTQQVDDETSSIIYTFDVMIEIRSAVKVHDMRRYIGGPFDSQEEKEAFAGFLRSTSCPELNTVSAVEILLPSELELADGDTKSSGSVIVGVLVGVTAVAFLAGIFIFSMSRRRRKVSQKVEEMNRDENSDPFAKTTTYEAHEYMSEIGLQTVQDMSSLGDPIPQGASASLADMATLEPRSIDYDFRATYRDRPGASSAPGLHETSSKFTIPVSISLGDDSTLNAQYATCEKWVFLAPSGLLGIVLETNSDGLPVVNSVRETSVLFDQVSAGDILVSVDGHDVSNMLASEVSKLIAAKQNQQYRKLVFIRPS